MQENCNCPDVKADEVINNKHTCGGVNPDIKDIKKKSNSRRGVKKSDSDSSNGGYLETRNIAGEENKSEQMPVNADNQLPATNEVKDE